MEFKLIDFIQQYIFDEMMAVVIVLLIIGLFLKMTPAVPDWLIVWILPAIGVALAVSMLGLNAAAFVQGILAAGFAVYLHQTWKQTKERE